MTGPARVLLLVEGHHDEAFIARILRERHGFKTRLRVADLDPYWLPTVPKDFPIRGELRRRVPVPMFYESREISLAIFPAEGIANLVNAAADTLALFQPEQRPAVVGFVLDADDEEDPIERFDALRRELLGRGIEPGERLGATGTAQPRCGVYVLPDNRNRGTLEALLLQCAATNYPAALAAARLMINGVVPTDYAGRDLEEFSKRAGRDKATIGAITAILKPGKTPQTSFSDNRWIDAATLALPDVKAIDDFLIALFSSGVSPADPAVVQTDPG